MKQFILILIVCVSTSVLAQKTDLVNAPENPIALKYKLEHFNLKGDVFSYDSKYYFNKEGFLIEKSDYQGDNIYTYKNGKLESDGSSIELQVNEQGYVTSQKLGYVYYGYSYNEKGLLTYSIETRIKNQNNPLVINEKKYNYDVQNRVIKEEKIANKALKESTTYSYKKIGSTLQVVAEVTETGKQPYRNEKYYIGGRLILSKDRYSDIPSKIESKLDAKGNSINDKHFYQGKETDTFDYSIVYYSDANNPLEYKIVIKKDSNGSLYQHIYRNGSYFYSDKKKQLDNTNDLLFYDDLTKNYYIATNAYDKTLGDGTTIKMELIAKNSEALLKNLPENKVVVSSSKISNNTATASTPIKTPTAICISGNCIDGYGEQKTINNSTITGFFKNGKPNGFGKETYNDGSGFYEGTFKDGFRDGYGFYLWNSDQQYYIGQWKAGKFHGYGYTKKGTEVLQAGYYEDGKQTKNMLTQAFIDKKAIGNCIGDCNNGFGFYQYANNDKYVGFFTNSKRNYIGAYTWVSGNAFMGEFYNDQLSGQASEFYKVDGSTYYGTFLNGKRQGLGAYYNKSNSLQSKGVWENGILKTGM